MNAHRANFRYVYRRLREWVAGARDSRRLIPQLGCDEWAVLQGRDQRALLTARAASGQLALAGREAVRLKLDAARCRRL